MDQADLLDLKKKVDTAGEEVTRLQGQEDLLKKQLKKDWGCSTIEQARKKVKVMERQIEELEDKIEEGISDLEENYEV